MKIVYSDDRQSLQNEALSAFAKISRQRQYILVPDRRKLQTERRLLEAMDERILFRTEVLSFSRFAFRVAGELGTLSKRSLTSQLTALLFHQLLQQGEPYESFGSLMHHPSFLPELAKQIQEFRRYELESTDLLRLADRLNETGERATAKQAFEFSRLLQDYTDFMRLEGIGDRVDHLATLEHDLLRGLQPDAWTREESFRLQRLNFLQNARILVLGFGEQQALTRQEAKILSLLDQYCASLYVTLQMPTLPTDPLQGPEDEVYFSAAYMSWQRLLSVGAQLEAHAMAPTQHPLGLTLRSLPFEPKFMPEPETASEHETTSEPKTETEPESSPVPLPVTEFDQSPYTLRRFPDTASELRFILGDLLSKKISQNMVYRDFAIAVPDQTMLSGLRRMAQELGIPAYFDQAVQVRDSLPVAALRLLFDLVRYGLRLENLISYLRNPIIDATEDEVDVFENFCLARGIEGYRFDQDWRFQENWTQALRGEESGAMHPQYFFKQKHLSPVLNLLMSMHQATDRFTRLDALREYLEETQWEDRVSHLGDVLPQEEAIHLIKSWNNLLEWMEDFALWSGSSEESLDYFVDAFMTGFEAGEMETIPSGLDQVLVTDPQNAAQGSFNVLYIIGATQENFPGSSIDQPLLKRNERMLLQELSIMDLPDPDLEDERQAAAILYNSLCHCAKEVHLSHHNGEDSDPLVVERLKKVYLSFEPETYTRTISAAAHDSRLASFAWAKQAFLSLPARTLASPVEARAWRAVLATLKSQDPQFNDELESLFSRISSADDPNARRQLPEGLVHQRLGEHPVFSASQLETYAACPFAYFMNYFLRLEDRQIWEAKVTNIGELMHGILEYTYDELIRLLRTVPDALREWVSEDPEVQVERAYQRLMMDNPQLRVFLEPENTVSITRFAKIRTSQILADQRLMPDDYVAHEAEWSFGPGQVFTPTFEADGPYGLRGLVDRIDRSITDPTIFAVRDYKSSERTFEAWSYLAGLEIQLPLYALALQQFFDQALDGGQVRSAAWVDLSLKKTELAEDEAAPTNEAWEERRFKDAANKVEAIEGKIKNPNWPRLIHHTERISDHWAREIRSGKMPANAVLGVGNYKAQCEWCEHRAACGLSNPAITARDYRNAVPRAADLLRKLEIEGAGDEA